MLRTDEERELVRVMVEARLFVSELAGDVPSFGVAHEALLRRWPRVAEWIERHRASLQLRTRIAGQAARWSEANRKKDLLVPRGSQVNQAAELLQLQDFSLAPLEKEFVRASISRARLAQRLLYGITGLIAVLSVLTTIFGISARSAQREAERSRGEAEGLMTYMLGDFVEKLRPIGRLDLLDDVGNKALDYVGKSDARSATLPALVSRMKALRIIAEVDSSQGRQEQYLRALMTSRDLVQNSLANFPMQPELLREAGINAFHLGQFYEKRNDLDQAQKFFVEYLDQSNRYATVTSQTDDGWMEQSFAHDALGTVAMKVSDYATAKKEFTLSLELKRKASTVRKADDSMTNQLATTVSWYAESTLKAGDPAKAMSLYRQEEELLKGVRSNNAATKVKLASSLMRQALLSTALGDRKLALDALLQAEHLSLALVEKDPTNRSWQIRLLTVRGRIAELNFASENAKETFSRFQEVCDKLRDLYTQEPQNTYLAYQTVKFELGRTPMLLALGNNKEALSNTDNAIAELEGLWRIAGKDKTALTFLAEALLIRADLTRKLVSELEATPYCKRTAELLKGLSGTTNDFSILASQIRANACLGNTAEVMPEVSRLQALGYRDERYLQFISTHPSLKGKL